MHPFVWRFPGLRGDCLKRKPPSRKRPDRAFRPDGTKALEARIALSSFGAAERGSTRASSRIADRNIWYPTPSGPSQRLDVYLPEGPVPAGGRPVLIAI